jgi:hypothetical protein
MEHTTRLTLGALADRFPTDTDVEAVSVAMMKEWARQEPHSDVTLYPTSYVATFVDMAKAALAALAERELR